MRTVFSVMLSIVKFFIGGILAVEGFMLMFAKGHVLSKVAM